MITNHHIRLTPPEIPYRQASVLFVECNERLHHIVHPCRLGISKQRMRCTESVPQREGTVIHPTVSLMHLFVGAIILAVHIAINGRRQHTVIQGCIEIHPVVGFTTRHLNPLQAVVPFLLGFRQISIKVVVRRFHFQILHGPFHTDTRQGSNHRHLFSLFGIEKETGNLRRTHLFTFQHNLSLFHVMRLERT